MLLRNPTLSCFLCVSADSTLDPTRAIADPFPTIVYDGGLHLRLYTNPTTSASEAYPLLVVLSLSASIRLVMSLRVLSILFPSPYMIFISLTSLRGHLFLPHLATLSSLMSLLILTFPTFLVMIPVGIPLPPSSLLGWLLVPN